MGESMQIQGQPGGCTKALVLKREIKPITINNNKARGDKQASVQCHVQFGSNSLPRVSKSGRLK